MIMKKQYINPVMEVVKLTACQTLLAGSGPDVSSISIDDGFADSRFEDLDWMSDDSEF